MLMQTHEARLKALREELKRCELDGFIIPISDEHMSEYVGEYAERLAWLTGFGGSAGFAAVTLTHAAIFVDGRYTVQVREQVDEKLFEYRSIPGDSLGDWLKDVSENGAKIAYDPWLHTWGWVEALEAIVEPAGITMVPADSNPLDAVWADQPAPSDAQAIVHTEDLAGRSSADKRAEIADWLSAEGLDAVVVPAHQHAARDPGRSAVAGLAAILQAFVDSGRKLFPDGRARGCARRSVGAVAPGPL